MWLFAFRKSSLLSASIVLKVIKKFARCTAPPHRLPRANSRLAAMNLPCKLRTENDDLHQTKYEFIRFPYTKPSRARSIPSEFWEGHLW